MYKKGTVDEPLSYYLLLNMNVAYHDACCHDAFESQAAKADQREPLQRAPFL